MNLKNQRKKEILHDLGARFLAEENNGSSLLTVTNVDMKDDGKRAIILFTVLPTSNNTESLEQLEKTALEFAKRKRSEFVEYVKKESKIGIIPFLDFDIDYGEKNRQKIDSLLG